MIIKHFYIAEGEKAEQVAKEGLEKANAIRKMRLRFQEEVGASGLYERSHQPPIALVFVGNDKKPGFLPPLVIDYDKNLFAYEPDRRTKIGKAMRGRLDGLASFNFSDFACQAYGIHGDVIGAGPGGRMALYSPAAGYLKGKLVFVIPKGGDSDDIAVPDGFREIKGSEYMALTEED
jgi:hypothetical protein